MTRCAMSNGLWANGDGTDRLAANDIETLSHVVDWASKQVFFNRFAVRGTVTPARLRQLDLTITTSPTAGSTRRYARMA